LSIKPVTCQHTVNTTCLNKFTRSIVINPVYILSTIADNNVIVSSPREDAQTAKM